MNPPVPLRYFKEDVPKSQLSKKRLYKKKYQEQIYGLKMNENEKTRKIVAMVNSKKIERAKQRKREKKMLKSKLQKQKKKQAAINKRRHRDGKWRAVMMKLSVELKKGRVQEGHWRRHELERENKDGYEVLRRKRVKKNRIKAEEIRYRSRILAAAREALKKGEDPEAAAEREVEILQKEEEEEKAKKKKSKKGKSMSKKKGHSKSMADLTPYKIKRRKVYTKEEIENLSKKPYMKQFKSTNKHGVTEKQEEAIIKMQEEKRPPEIVIESEQGEHEVHILRKRVIKRYFKPYEKEEDKIPEEENEDEEDPIEEANEEEEDRIEEKVKEEEKEEEAVEKEPAQEEEVKEVDDGKYKPLYPTYEENKGVEDQELEGDGDGEDQEDGGDDGDGDGDEDQGN